jgi:hypothetical protein
MRLSPTQFKAKVALNEINERCERLRKQVYGEETTDWWCDYFGARIALRDLALMAISENRESHPDRQSMDFKEVSSDINDAMMTLIDPDHNCVKCPKCNEMTLDPERCIVCFVRGKLGL